MKKLLALAVATLLLWSPAALANESIRVAVLQGPTAMGMVQMMRDSEGYEFSVEPSADLIVPSLIQGKLDIAALPANAAAGIYANSDGAIRTLAVNTLGVLYIVERGDTVQTMEDLRGRTLYASGKGSTPEYALNCILRGNGLDPLTDLTVEYKSEHAECLAALLSDPSAAAMLPQPFVTVAQAKAPDMRVALDLTAEWDALQTDADAPSAMITGVLVARADFIDSNPESVAGFLNEYAESVLFTQENIPEAAHLIGEFGIFDAAVAEKALPFCNIVCITGAEMRTLLSGYLSEMHAQDPASVGGALPDDAFYHVPE